MNNEDKQFIKELVGGLRDEMSDIEDRIMTTVAKGFAEAQKEREEVKQELTRAGQHREELAKRIQNRHLDATDKFATKEQLDTLDRRVCDLENA